VLQRIGLASIIAAPLIVFGSWRLWIGAMLALFAIYSVLMLAVPVSDVNGVVVAGALEVGRDFGAYIDRAVFGNHVWRSAKTWDPEGLVSTLPAVGNVLVGAMLGLYLRRKSHAGVTQCVWLFVLGFSLIFVGEFLAHALMPVNKNLWTVSYSMLMSGWALVAFAAFYWLLDVCEDANVRANAHALCKPFLIYGVNALFIFVLSGLIGRLLVFTKVGGAPLKNAVFAPFAALPLEPRASSLLYALAFNLLMLGVAWVMWKKKWFIKL
jgi:predicted acyltransferase